MWTLISGIDFRAAKRKAARFIVGATVLLGTGTHLAMALFPEPTHAAPAAPAAGATSMTTQLDETATLPAAGAPDRA